LRARWQLEAEAQERAGAQAVAVSLGTASYPAHGATAEALCAVADGTMYEEKRRGAARPSRGHRASSNPQLSENNLLSEPGGQTSRSTT